MPLASLLLASCMSVPADPPPDRQRPAQPQPVAPEPAPVVVKAAVDSPGEALMAGGLYQLYSCFFEKPYRHMFRSSPNGNLQIGQRSFGSFEAGVSGIMSYGSLAACAGRLSGTEKRTYSDDGPMAALAGLPLFGPQMGSDQPFGFYNPDLVRWGHSYLLPDPASTIEGVAAQQIYDHVFQRFFRTMAESYVDLAAAGTYAQDQRDYWQMAQAKQQNGIDWLTNRYGGRLRHLDRPADGTAMSVPMAYGFWLRRGIDGTQPELWVGLRKLLERYDGRHYAALQEQATSAHVEW
jgi:hypothetical protein